MTDDDHNSLEFTTYSSFSKQSARDNDGLHQSLQSSSNKKLTTRL